MSDLVRSLQIIETEINFYKQQTATGIIEIGKRLIEAKSQMQHGEWGKWLEEKVEFTHNTANKFMRIASNYDSHHNLGTQKLWLLLDVPQEERENFIKENKVDELTTRQLQEEINAYKRKYESRENAIKSHQMALDEEKEKNKELEQKLRQQQKPQIIEKEIVREVIPSDIQLKVKKLEADLERWKMEAESYKGDSKKLEQVKESIKHLESHRDNLNEYIFQSENLSKLRAGVLSMLKNDLAPLRYSGLIEASKNNNDLMKTMIEITDAVRLWLEDITKELQEKIIIDARMVSDYE